MTIRNRCLVAAFVLVASTAPVALAEQAPPRDLVPADPLVTFRVVDPSDLEERRNELGPVGSFLPSLPDWFAQMVGLVGLEGVAFDHPWYLFVVREPEDAKGPWLLLPLKDEDVFERHVLEASDQLRFVVREDYALLGLGPLPRTGGNLPPSSFTTPVELQVQVADVYQVFKEDMIWTFMATFASESGEPFFNIERFRLKAEEEWDELAQFWAQCDRLVLGLDFASRRWRARLTLDFHPESSLGSWLKEQRPASPAGLGRMNTATMRGGWFRVDLSGSEVAAELLLEAVGEWLGGDMELQRRINKANWETLWTTEEMPGVTRHEVITRLYDRSIKEHRALIGEFTATIDEDKAIFEPNLSHIGALPVDRLTEYQVGDRSAKVVFPWPATSYYAWSEKEAFAVKTVGEPAQEGYQRLFALVSREDSPLPQSISSLLDSFPSELIFLDWRYLRANLEAPSGIDRSSWPAIAFYGTTRGPVLEIGATFDAQHYLAYLEKHLEVDALAKADYDEGNKYYNAKDGERDYQKAAEWYRQAASKGHLRAINRLGYMHEKGLGGPEDYSEALRWYREGARRGLGRSQKNLADLYYYGRGVDKDYAKAAYWYGQSSDRGYHRGHYALAVMFERGRGVEQDVDIAVELYKAAASHNYTPAQIRLGWLYQNGRGVEKDLVESVAWYRAAAEKGDADAQFQLGAAYEGGGGVEADAQVAAEWYRKAAEQNQAKAQLSLGIAYELGLGVPKDVVAAAEWYRRSADNGYKYANTNLGRLYELGLGVTQDSEEAVRRYEIAAEKGVAHAKYLLANMYYEGEGVQQDKAMTIELLREAAKKGHWAAHLRLGDLYVAGNGVERDFQEALKWYRAATEKGSPDALVKVGLLYEFGKVGVAPDPAEAAKWYQAAADKEDTAGYLSLGRMYLMGAGVPQDNAETYFWLSLALDTKNEDQRELAQKLLEELSNRLSESEKRKASERVEAHKSRSQ